MKKLKIRNLHKINLKYLKIKWEQRFKNYKLDILLYICTVNIKNYEINQLLITNEQLS